jgi:L-alanine-DL-glutamate epimerase-like enolase superfamily enzyme
MRQRDLGVAFQAIGEREPGTAHLEHAVTAYRAAAEVVSASRRGIGPNVELMVDAHGSLEVATAILRLEVVDLEIA